MTMPLQSVNAFLTCMAVKEGLLNIDPGQLTISDQG
jgi:hypothetical protein